jgi:hypothetical protein
MQTSAFTSTLVGFFKKHFGRNKAAYNASTNKKETGMEDIRQFRTISEANSPLQPNESTTSSENSPERLAPSPKPKVQKKARKARKG